MRHTPSRSKTVTHQDLLLRDFRPRTALVTEDHTPDRARLPVIDAHNHLPSALDNPAELVTLMDALNIHAIVDLNGGWGEQLDRYPNLFVDLSARIGELGRQPYTARWFLTQYADRVLFGTDMTPSAKIYRIYYRCLETADEYFEYGGGQGRYRIYGLDLPNDVLCQIYHENACRLIPGLELSGQKNE